MWHWQNVFIGEAKHKCLPKCTDAAIILRKSGNLYVNNPIIADGLYSSLI